MAEQPNKRARRPDSKQMWDKSDKHAPIPSRERDEPPRERKDDRDRDRRNHAEKDRNRRYRSRSPRDSRDLRGGRDQAHERGGSGRGRYDRDEDGRRDGGRDGKDRGGGRESREKPRMRSRSRDKERRRSRSPRKERGSEAIREKRSKPVTKQSEEGLKERTATPPVSFRVGGQDHDRMDTDGDHRQVNVKGGLKQDKVEEEPMYEDDDEIVVEDDGMAAMQAMMGFGGFGTTHQKKVPGNDISAVRKEKKTEYRQYMNRVGGFNRPLSPTRE